MPIEYEGLSDRRSASRMGKIRLGKKGRNAQGVEYPEKLDYFRIDPSDESLLPKLLELLGAKPKRLRIMFVSGDREVIFPQYLRKYGKSGLLCKGTGGTDAGGNPLPAVLRVVDTETGAVVDDYPCDPATCQDYQGKRCKRVASLSGFILCEFPNIRTWQIDTTSKVSIENLNSRFDELENLLTAAGRGRTVAGVPLILTLNPIRVKARDKKGKPLKGKQTVFVMDLDLDTESLMSDSPPLAFLRLSSAVSPPGTRSTRRQSMRGPLPMVSTIVRRWRKARIPSRSESRPPRDRRSRHRSCRMTSSRAFASSA
jgi:hypothetical protein